MHTLVLSSTDNDLWNVVYSSNYGHLSIADNLPKDEAMQLVNYLNGGSGSVFIPSK